jgi:mRNA interferase MazF
MIPGKIVLAKLPQNDGILKPRPALILKAMPPFGDFLVCGFSSKLHQQTKGFDEIITFDDQDFGISRLQRPSLIRLGWLETIPQSAFKGAIGMISADRLNRLVNRLALYLTQ